MESYIKDLRDIVGQVPTKDLSRFAELISRGTKRTDIEKAELCLLCGGPKSPESPPTP